MDGCIIRCSNLESLLEDASALEAFREWFKDGTRPTDSIDLYFAIKAFKYTNVFNIYIYLLNFNKLSYG